MDTVSLITTSATNDVPGALAIINPMVLGDMGIDPVKADFLADTWYVEHEDFLSVPLDLSGRHDYEAITRLCMEIDQQLKTSRSGIIRNISILTQIRDGRKIWRRHNWNDVLNGRFDRLITSGIHSVALDCDIECTIRATSHEIASRTLPSLLRIYIIRSGDMPSNWSFVASCFGLSLARDNNDDAIAMIVKSSPQAHSELIRSDTAYSRYIAEHTEIASTSAADETRSIIFNWSEGPAFQGNKELAAANSHRFIQLASLLRTSIRHARTEPKKKGRGSL